MSRVLRFHDNGRSCLPKAAHLLACELCCAMIKHTALALLFILPLFCHAQKYPDYQSIYVNDFADVLSPQEKRRVAMMLAQAGEERDLEMTVLTINSQADYGFKKDIEDFATGLFNYWGVGDASRNDGILVLVAVEDRDMRIELGKGYPQAYDMIAQRIIDQDFIPHFKDNNYALGIESGVDEIIKRIDLNANPKMKTFSSPGFRSDSLGLSDSSTSKSGGFLHWVLGVLAAITAALGGFQINRYRKRHCELCGNSMKRLTESDDDAHLSHGQQVEESIRSRDYDVWFCPRDGHTQINSYKKWFSGHQVCRSCNFRTLDSQRTVLQSATTRSEGRALVEYECQHCDDNWSEYVSIPRLSESTSSTSSSSFSGGSSSGGGASGSW